MNEPADLLRTFEIEYARLCVGAAQALEGVSPADQQSILWAITGKGIHTNLVCVRLRQQWERTNEALYHAATAGVTALELARAAKQARKTFEGEWMLAIPRLGEFQGNVNA